MNNEIKRKITSLTLMTIMLAGGMSFAMPSMVPAAHAANANLFVSAENSQFSNYMSGPQVIEVVVIDSDINDTDQAKGEPDVTVNGKILRMVQAVDGNWYGYFADRTQASIADYTANAGVDTEGLNFGTLCATGSTTEGTLGITISDTVGVAIPLGLVTGQNGTSTGAALTTQCSVDLTNSTRANVVRESKTLNGAISGTDTLGQIGLGRDGLTDAQAGALWPFIQLYPLTVGGNVVIQYNKGGGVQTTTLTFDTVDQFIDISVDRTSYPQSGQVHLTVTDLWLNIDPTDEDSWTFGTNSDNTLSTNYQVFSENGVADGAAVSNGIINISGNLTSLMNPDAVLTVNTDAQSIGTPVITLQDTDDVVYTTCTTAASCVATGSAVFGLGANTQPVTLVEQGPNSGIFGTYDESDQSQIKIASGALRGTSATVDYDVTKTILVANSFATIDIQATDDEWNSGEEIPVVLVDADANKNSRADEDLLVSDPNVTLIPSLSTGDPFTLGEETNSTGITAIYADVSIAGTGIVTAAYPVTTTVTVDQFSQIGRIDATASSTVAGTDSIIIDLKVTMGDLRKSITNTNSNATAPRLQGLNLLNLDVSSFNSTGVFDVYLLNYTTNILTGSATSPTALSGGVGSAKIASNVSPQSLTSLNSTDLNYKLFRTALPGGAADANEIGLLIQHKVSSSIADTTNVISSSDDIDPIAVDFFSFGFTDDGLQASERISNQIIRIEVEETGDNTSTFEGTLEYVMINQLNIKTAATYTSLETITDTPTFIVIEDLTDEDAPRVNYLDLGADGVSTQVADQQNAPSHSGVVSLDNTSYKVADTVTITLQDLDLNVDSELIDIFTTVSTTSDVAFDTIGKAALPTLSWGDLGQMLDVTFDDQQWRSSATAACVTDLGTIDTGLNDAGFTLVETAPESGIFVGDFQIPSKYCRSGDSTGSSVTGTDIEVNYVDFRDASGEIIEVGDGAGVRASTGSVSLDRTVYPVPFGIESDFADQDTKTTPSGRALFPIHQSGMASTSSTTGLSSSEYIANGDLTIHVRVNDPDFNLSASGEDTIGTNATGTTTVVGPVKISVIRGSSTVILGYAGGPAALLGTIDTNNSILNSTRQFGPMTEIAPDAGIFESDIVVRYTDGPASSSCPSVTDTWTNIAGGTGTTETDRFDIAATSGDYCILQGDILQVEYTDPTDASGDVNTVTDSATFDLRNGVLQSDKSVYIIGSDMILTLIEPDFDLDNDQAETYDLDLIEWDSDAATVTMGNADGESAAFDPEPSSFRETGDSTGIFQIVVEIPSALGGDNLERGEEIVLEYSDWGPSGSDFVGDEDEDVNLTIFTSNFGATVELDQKVYTWTDKVYITIVAPDHNFDSNLVDEVGDTSSDPIKVSTRGQKLSNYKLVETGTDTGIFTGEVILTGFTHDADGDTTTGTNGNDVTTTSPSGTGPTDGLLPADDDDGITVSFEFSEDETIVGSALIRWNIGEVQWLEASYPASGTGVVRVIDPDMNLKPEAVDNFNTDVWSDSDAGGIDLTVTETNEATGIFEGTVFFTTTDESSGHRLRVAEGDTVTAEYSDNTLPSPYTTADELDITATSLIGTVVPPLERAPAANLRVVDAFGNSLSTVNVDQQVQITADLANGQDREQAFAYLVQIQDGNGVTVSLAWITGSLSAGQSFSPALSWIPTDAGTYTATAFVWESVDNPTALSPPVTTTITVQ